ncbi:DUF6600 domain-containing protein, partial [Lichenicoccus roseus]|uniref:DUF6600 domain-containing protein n=1 Tax=Lichenicoccus roseus TaxID=2683649 RepID=UPI00197CB5BF
APRGPVSWGPPPSPLGARVRAVPPRAGRAAPRGGPARLARLDGTVSTHGPGGTQWTPAILNFPLTSGDALWTEPPAQADVEIGQDLLTLAAHTELDLDTLDNLNAVAGEPQGALFVDLRGVQPGETWTFNTPRGAVQIAADGQYEILAGDAATATRVVIVRGAAQFTSGALVLRGGAGQMLVASGNDTLQGDVEALGTPDAFLAAMLARTDPSPLPIPQAAIGMTGADQLGGYGSWQSDPQYGEAWYPQVDPDWAPYGDGSWSFVEPWGWTWVDAEPWGFAPFHYGRWFRSGGRWGWSPGTYDHSGYRPTYAPALVDFLAVGAGAGLAAGALTAALLAGHGRVGWVPLGPHEFYQPAYHTSASYLGRLNHGGGWHRPSWDDAQGGTGFVNRTALVVAPATAILRSSRIGSLRGPAPRQGPVAGSGSIRTLRDGLPLKPGPETRGLSLPAARRIGLASGPIHPLSPGPTAATRPQFALPVASAAGSARQQVQGPGLPRGGPARPPHVDGPLVAPGPELGRPDRARPDLPRILTPRSPAPVLPNVPLTSRPLRPTLQRPTVQRPELPRIQAPYGAAPAIAGPRFSQPRFAEPPHLAQPRMPGPRMGPMLRPAAPMASRAAPVAPGRPPPR